MSFDWQNGRQLASVAETGLTASYKYNSDGIRTQKTVNGVTTNYTLEGSSVVKETNGTDTLWYYYDATGSVTSFELNGTPYFYVKNQHGDIIAITDATGEKVVEYVYDSWGKLISTTGSLASTVGEKNPYRYRGYRYDTETGLYYVSSRYYDPETCRFINADNENLVTASPATLTDKNQFTYCDNNPIMRADDGGDFWHFVAGAVVGGLISGGIQIVSNLISGNKWTDGLGTAVLTGAASGVLAATGVGLFGSVVGNAAISMAGNATNQVIKNRGMTNFDVGDMLVDGVIGGFAGAVGGRGMGKSANIKTLNKNLTKKVFSGSSNVARDVARKGIKYYVSQTRFAYKNFLFKPLMKAGGASLIGYGSKAVYLRCR